MTTRWKYYDRRQWIVDANQIKEQFAVVSIAELERAYSAGLTPNALCLWLVLLHRVNGRTSEAWALGAKEISQRTGMSRATIYRSIAQLKSAGLVGSSEEAGKKICWLSIPRTDSIETQTADNDSGKLPEKSQNCDKPTALEKSQKSNTASPSISRKKVSSLRQDPRINSRTRIKPGGTGTGHRSELQREEGAPRIATDLIETLYSKICEDSEDSLATIQAWRESPEQSAAQITRKRWKMRSGPDCSDLNLWGWYGTHRIRDVAGAMLEAMKWRRGEFPGF